MSTTGHRELSPIPVSIDNPERWDEICGQILREAGLPTTLTPRLLTGLIADAVPLLFEADDTRDASILRGAFTDRVIAQCLRNAGCFRGAWPLSAVVHLVGVPAADGHPVVRAHIAIQVQDAGGERGVSAQFWDFRAGAQVTVGKSQCPNCGAAIDAGELICRHCQTDVRRIVDAAVVVNRLELY